jgi:hypothetical protein
VTTTLSEISAKAQTLCLENARGWLDAAYAILDYVPNNDTERRASVLFAHAVCELGKAVDLYRAERLGEHPMSVLTYRDDRRFLESAREVLNEDLLSITGERRGIDDLLERLSAFAVEADWQGEDVSFGSSQPRDADSDRLRENVRAVQDRVRLAQNHGVRAIVLRPEEFAPKPAETVYSAKYPVVNTACVIQQRRLTERLDRRRRGPLPQGFYPAGLERIYVLRFYFGPHVKRFSRIYGDLELYERRPAAERELVRFLFPKLPTSEVKTLAAALVRDGNRRSDMVNVLIAKRLRITVACARRANRLLTGAERVCAREGRYYPTLTPRRAVRERGFPTLRP